MEWAIVIAGGLICVGLAAVGSSIHALARALERAIKWR